jgi:hypothetical protein
MKENTRTVPGKGDELVIRGKSFAVTTEWVEQSKLRFYADNPRIYSEIHTGGAAPDQDEIFEALQNMDHVKVLVGDIKKNGGLIEPLIVHSRSMIVLEGNSRLAAYRILAKKGGGKWALVKCTLLPADIDDSSISSLLGQYHLKGKTKWSPFEQAGFLYRRHVDHEVSIEELSDEVGIKASEVALLVKTHDFMRKHNEWDADKWSYYYEMLKSPKIARVRNVLPDFDQFIVKEIKAGRIEKAADLRKKLPLICQDGKALNKYMLGKVDFDGAYEQGATFGKGEFIKSRLSKFAIWLSDPELAENMLVTNSKMRDQFLFELNRIDKSVSRISSKLKME